MYYHPVLMLAALLMLYAMKVEAIEIYPTLRFTPWKNLHESAKAEGEILGYRSERSWNNLGSNSIERLSYETIKLQSERKAQAIEKLLEEAEDSWDCYINHYDDYTWDELELWGIQEAFITMGYDENLWQNDQAPRPEVENEDWVELTPEHQEAALYVCYTQEIWDEVPLPDWKENQIHVESDGDDGNLQTIIAAACVMGFALLAGITFLFVRIRRGKQAETTATSSRHSSLSSIHGSGSERNNRFGTVQVPTITFRAKNERQCSLSVHSASLELRDDDISTLEVPTVVDGMSYGDDNTESIVSSKNQLEDRRGRFGCASETESVSPDSSMEEHSLSCCSGSAFENGVVTSSSSFEDQFCEGRDDVDEEMAVERFRVKAPPGKLGIVLDTPFGNEPTVIALKPDSILLERVRTGDRLLSVNGKDVTSMDAEQVSELISSQSSKHQRLVFAQNRERCNL